MLISQGELFRMRVEAQRREAAEATAKPANVGGHPTQCIHNLGLLRRAPCACAKLDVYNCEIKRETTVGACFECKEFEP